jgi:hypothetical protein
LRLDLDSRNSKERKQQPKSSLLTGAAESTIMETEAAKKISAGSPDMVGSEETLTPSSHGQEPPTEEDDVVAPLNLNHRDLQWPRYDEEEVASLITDILAKHPGPGRRFSFHVVHLHRRPATVDAWLQSRALDGLEELEFDIGGRHQLAPEPPLPASVFRFAATLRVATFAKCRFPDDGALLCFPQLRELGLEDVAISEGALHGVIAGCPVLESLLLTGRSRFGCIRINSQSLVSLGLRVYTEELIIEDAPLLERLLQLEFRIATHLSVISAPKLETLGCLSDLDFYSKLTSQAAVIKVALSLSLFNFLQFPRAYREISYLLHL